MMQQRPDDHGNLTRAISLGNPNGKADDASVHGGAAGLAPRLSYGGGGVLAPAPGPKGTASALPSDAGASVVTTKTEAAGAPFALHCSLSPPHHGCAGVPARPLLPVRACVRACAGNSDGMTASSLLASSSADAEHNKMFKVLNTSTHPLAVFIRDTCDATGAPNLLPRA